MMNNPKLKLAMARLLPEKIKIFCDVDNNYSFYWHGIDDERGWEPCFLETEWLYVMHLVETNVKICSLEERSKYIQVLGELTQVSRMTTVGWTLTTATFNQRANAMCKVKGIEE